MRDGAADVARADVLDVVTAADVTVVPDGVAIVDGAADSGVATDVTDAPAGPTPSCPRPDERGCARVVVEGGALTLGDVTEGPPQPGVTVSTFVVDASEVTVRRFRRFVAALDGGAIAERLTVDYPPPGQSHFSVNTTMFGAYVSSGGVCTWSAEAREGLDDHPINCVSWFAAMAFCIWDGGRLPTEAEYEYTARWWRAGATPRTYPWGDAPPDCARAQWRPTTVDPSGCRGDDGLATRRVGSLAAGALFGVHDLAGNVSEWCADEFLPYASSARANECWGNGAVTNPVCRSMSVVEHSVRGGNWGVHVDEPRELSGVARQGASGRATLPLRGFRCVRSR